MEYQLLAWHYLLTGIKFIRFWMRTVLGYTDEQELVDKFVYVTLFIACTIAVSMLTIWLLLYKFESFH